jgi:hypothetical protein
MEIFGHHRHGTRTPWEQAPPWAIELHCILGLILEHQELTMAAIDDLKTAVTDLHTEVGALGTEMDTLFTDLTNAIKGGNDAEIAAAVVAVQAAIDDLKAIGTRDAPPVA